MARQRNEMKEALGFLAILAGVGLLSLVGLIIYGIYWAVTG
ncbi:hypothetical protein C2W64_04084 [Brevibacillus laterosporus]|nr:hypothetical protein [Brevibacillus laterosporus]RAP29137.1 hypothetical protein C2W64_04084 [Brevibacillus laterosporus]